jgi:hypothetical protein
VGREALKRMLLKPSRCQKIGGGSGETLESLKEDLEQRYLHEIWAKKSAQRHAKNARDLAVSVDLQF